MPKIVTECQRAKKNPRVESRKNFQQGDSPVPREVSKCSARVSRGTTGLLKLHNCGRPLQITPKVTLHHLLKASKRYKREYQLWRELNLYPVLEGVEPAHLEASETKFSLFLASPSVKEGKKRSGYNNRTRSELHKVDPWESNIDNALLDISRLFWRKEV